ncbi:hypothetical protein WOLCODRAFT_146793 [Wolfiporia cocos MD-104 SS10]|uniref:DUF6534 domain-containing protein n=1 Tax=Wolfiporia cocos (strain MD-104) TaxID=742152 RepID=A0A2H3J9R5_WOLCO|nr:hypothetical protein WOLCODRAFT_146793 [Wolfiporia cocos MD-104 SS10]
MGTASVSSHHLNATLGAFLLGNIFTAMLIDCAHLTILTYMTFTYTIVDFSDYFAIEEIIWCLPVIVLLMALSDIVVRCLFCQRIYKLSGGDCRLVLPILVTGLTAFVLATSFHPENNAISSPPVSCTVDRFNALTTGIIRSLLYATLSLDAFGDIMTAAVLCMLLRRNTVLLKLETAVNTLILYTIETGLLTSICAITCFILYATMPHNYIYIAMFLVLTKLALNSLLAMLNARRSLRETGGLASATSSAQIHICKCITAEWDKSHSAV